MRDLSGDRAVPDQGEPVAVTGRNMAVERVPAGVEPRPLEPAVKGRAAVVEHLVPAPLPIDRLRRLGPELLGPFERAAIDFAIPHLGALLPSAFAAILRHSEGIAKRVGSFGRLPRRADRGG